MSEVIASLDAGVSVNAEDRPHAAGEIGILKTSALCGGVFRPEQNKAVWAVERGRVAEPVIADSILLSRMNTPALVGESCYVGDDWPTLFVPDRIWQLKPRDRESLSMRWLSYVLRGTVARAHIETHATGTSGSMKNLPKSRLLDLKVCFPPVGEQRLIAEILDTLDATIRQTEAIIEKLKQVKQGLLHDLLTRGIDANGDLRPPQSQAPDLYKESPLGWIPREWEAKGLADYMSSEITYGIVQAGPHVEGGVPYIRTGDMSGDQLVKASLQCTSRRIADSFRRSEVRSGDMVMAIRATVGKVLPVPDELDGANLTQGTARLAPNAQTNASFLLWALRHQRAQDSILAEIKGTTFAEITLAALREVLLAAPVSREEQESIGERVNACEARIRAEHRNAGALRALKSGLMDDLLTGRVRVTPLLAPAAP